MALFFVLGCQSVSTKIPERTDALFRLRTTGETGIDFINEVEDGSELNILTYRNFYNGGGVAIGDINQDGLEDIYFTSNLKGNRLFLNKGDLTFQDITIPAGVSGSGVWSSGVTMVDVNNDGLIDIYVCNSGHVEGGERRNELFINNGDLTFSEQAEHWGLNSNAYSMQSSFFDYDMDGDLDCYLLNNSLIVPEPAEFFQKSRMDIDTEGGDKLYRNDGDQFTDVTTLAGIYTSDVGFGLGVSVSDLNGDMLPDIYVSNDFWERDYLYMNQGDGTFSEQLENRFGSTSMNSMGADIGDLNNDGFPDLMSTDMLPGDNYRIKTMTVFDPFFPADSKYRAGYHYQLLQNALQLNTGSANFSEIGQLAGVSASDWSWGTLIFDFDNDGWKDIYVSNAIYHEVTSLDFTEFIANRSNVDQMVQDKGQFDWRDFAALMSSIPQSNYAFVNGLGKAGAPGAGQIPTFRNMADSLGLAVPSYSNGAAYGDLDNDGDLDLVVNNVNMEAFLFENSSTHNYLKIKFDGGAMNPMGIGTQVRISCNGINQVLQYYPTRSFESSVGQGLIFGLGEEDMVEELEVIWPDHGLQVLKNISPNQELVLSRSEATERFQPEVQRTTPLFRQVQVLNGDHVHKENAFNDFEHEILLPRMISTEGPAIITGDVNNDGLEDFILGGAAGDPDKLFLQDSDGWRKANTNWHSIAKQDRGFETTCGAIFDVDRDGDQDVILGSGGNEMQKGADFYRVRYYENIGSGFFFKNESKKPPALGNFSCIVPEDFDKDGDLDLFLGARIVPGNYGLIPRSYLLRNEGNRGWADVTTKELGTAGMINDAVWSDVDGDEDPDLILAGDWMPIKVFENTMGSLQFNASRTNQNLSGWWNTMEAFDLDGDGDEDYLAGNWGLNSKFKASLERPMSMYVKDFDNNGKSEPIIIWYAPEDSTAYPFATKEDMIRQLPQLKKSNKTYDAYARKTYQTLLSDQQRQDAITYRLTMMESSILINNGGILDLHALPPEAQISPVFAIVAEDLDGDELVDIWLGGNFYGLKPEAGYNNASKGVLLRGTSSGFHYVSPEKSGIEVTGEVRDAALFKSRNRIRILVARNNTGAVVFERQ